MAEVGIWLVALGRDPIGEWLSAYDPDRHDPAVPDGPTGWIDSSPEESKALRFPSIAAALDFSQQVSTVRPVRPDGLPNRPLRAFTLEFRQFQNEG